MISSSTKRKGTLGLIPRDPGGTSRIADDRTRGQRFDPTTIMRHDFKTCSSDMMAAAWCRDLASGRDHPPWAPQRLVERCTIAKAALDHRSGDLWR
jgi:hypothetical protein